MSARLATASFVSPATLPSISSAAADARSASREPSSTVIPPAARRVARPRPCGPVPPMIPMTCWSSSAFCVMKLPSGQMMLMNINITATGHGSPVSEAVAPDHRLVEKGGVLLGDVLQVRLHVVGHQALRQDAVAGQDRF